MGLHADNFGFQVYPAEPLGVYEEKIDPQDPSRYLHKGEWRPVRAETGTFRINGPHGIESVTLPLHSTYHGLTGNFDTKRHRAYAVELPKVKSVDCSAFVYALMKAEKLSRFQAAPRGRKASVAASQRHESSQTSAAARSAACSAFCLPRRLPRAGHVPRSPGRTVTATNALSRLLGLAVAHRDHRQLDRRAPHH